MDAVRRLVRAEAACGPNPRARNVLELRGGPNVVRNKTREPSSNSFWEGVHRLLLILRSRSNQFCRLDDRGIDLAICEGKCGGDLLFAEAAVPRQLALELYIPSKEEEFLSKSIDFADANWRSRFFAVKSQASLHIMPDELGPVATDEIYERNNLRMLEAVMRFGPKKLYFICLWNGEGGDGPGARNTLCKKFRRRAVGLIGWTRQNYGNKTGLPHHAEYRPAHARAACRTRRHQG